MTVDAKATFPASTPIVSEDLPSQSLFLRALAFYRSRKPVATAGCVLDDESCSQRFERKFLDAKTDGQGDIPAAISAIDYAATVCQKLNGGSKTEAILKRLLLGTAAAIVLGGASAASCSGEAQCPFCPGMRDCT